MTTLRPLYGVDYTRGKAAKKDFIAGKDFIVVGMFKGVWGCNGNHCSIRDFENNDIVELVYHYNKVQGKFLRKMAWKVRVRVHRLKDPEETML